MNDLDVRALTQRPLVAARSIHEAVRGRRVMITGAGGSIGSELSRQVAAASPASLVLVDHSELNLYEVNSSIEELFPEHGFTRLPALCDIRDLDTLRHLFRRSRPEIVFHAAALKHVPLLENDHNLVEAVRTNIGGTKNVADLCTAHGVDMVMISTDKAVNPSSVMGLTKRAAEIYVHGKALRHPDCRILQVRFGNVLGSSGSVVPKFMKQIEKGGPVTVTHPEMTRFLMTISEAVALVLAAADLHGSDVTGFGLYILEMGEPVKIAELARRLIMQSGKAVPIEFIGVRPGEKLFEELSYEWEALSPSAIPGVRVATPDYDPLKDQSLIDALLGEASARHVEAIKNLLVQLVPQYTGQWNG